MRRRMRSFIASIHDQHGPAPTRAGLMLALAGIAVIMMYPLRPVDTVFAAGDLVAVYRDGVVEVNVPNGLIPPRGGSVALEIIDAEDKTVGQATASNRRSSGAWRASIPVRGGVRIEDLAWYRLRITSNSGSGFSKTVSMSEILGLPIVRLFAQRSYAAGSTAALRLITAESRGGSPLPDIRIKIELLNGDRSQTLFTGRTNRLGTADVTFSLPEGDYGSRQFRVTADTALGPVIATQQVQLDRRDRILLTTDKPLYQPGQTMHVRALALDGPSRAARANQPITLEIEDGKGNKVFKKRGATDRFGIASADFELADEVNFGPYHIRAILGDDRAQTTQEKTVKVDRYTLPKFKIEIELAGDKKGQQSGYYRPGDTVSGNVTARYLFGKPIAHGEVAVTLTTFDVQAVELGRVTGKTDVEGRFPFSSRLPDFLAGRSTEQGSAPVSISVDVKDTASHTESKSRNVLVSNTSILIMAVPESGRLLPGLDNRVYILTSYPDGTPAETEITGTEVPAGLKTDASGVATISIRGESNPTVLTLQARDRQGRAAQATVNLESQSGSQSLMLRSNKAVYRVGDTLALETLSTRAEGAVYIDVVKDGQTIATRAIDTADGRGDLSIGLTAEMFGALEVRAYQITRDAEPILDRRLIYVDPADDLKVEISADRDGYKPGEDACINFHTTDHTGRPVSAALGIEIVDEAVFALSDKQPGFEKVFMNLEKELLTPRYEVHQFSFEKVLLDDSDDDPPAQAARRERAAQVLFAAAGTAPDRDVRVEGSGREFFESGRAKYAAAYAMRTSQLARTLAAEMTEYYAHHPASPEGFGADLLVFAAGSSVHQKMVQDPWGNPFVGEGRLPENSYAYLTLRSLGPDGRAGTDDDITIEVYAHRGPAPRDGSSTMFSGHASTLHDVVGGGRTVIEGTVKDNMGKALEQVQVTARRISTGRIYTVHTGPPGRFTIPDLAPGRYEIRFEGAGFEPMRYLGPKLRAGDRSRLETILQPFAGSPMTLSVYPDYVINAGKDMPMGRKRPMALKGGRAGGVGSWVVNINGNAEEVVDSAKTEMAFEAKHIVSVSSSGVELMSLAALAPPAGAPAEPRIRSFFPETLFVNPSLITDGQGQASIHVPMADSITTWRVTSLASTMRGLLGSATFPIRVFQDFFVDLDLPSALTQGDAVSVPAAVYNYLPTPQRVQLELRQDPWFTLDGDTAAKQVQVGAGEVSVVFFRLKAAKIGRQQLQVTARLDDAPVGLPGDAVARSVEVLPNGEEKSVVINDRLESSATKEIVIPKSAIPGASKIMVKFYPGALSQVVEGLDSILQMPGGCFEQTSSSTYPDVLAMDYLKTSKKITPEVQAKADGYISLGYQRLVTFEVPSGGFSWFGQQPANKILTAYGLMEFSDMSRVHEVDPRLIERTQNWLASQQAADGSFKPDTYFINEGATTRYNTDVLRITAYIGWALASTGYKGQAVDKAREYSRSHTTGKEDAYTLAVLANFAVDSGDREWTASAIEKLAARVTEDEKTAHWKQDGETPTSARETSADLETTALAAQALLKSGRKGSLAKKALDYLTSKKDSFGNWQTTQATILSLKAFLLSFTHGTAADTAGTIAVSVDGKPVQEIQITKDNNDLLQAIDLKPYTHAASQKIGLRFDGKGSMEYQIVGRYYLPWSGPPGPPAPREPLTIQVSYDRTLLSQDELAAASVKVRNNTPAKAKMIMVDLGIPPGFEPRADDFGALMDATQNKSGGKLEKYTITARQVILYFDGLNPGQQVEFSYKLRAKYPLRAKAFSSRVYEYYNPEVQGRTQPVELSVVGK